MDTRQHTVSDQAEDGNTQMMLEEGEKQVEADNKSTLENLDKVRDNLEKHRESVNNS